MDHEEFFEERLHIYNLLRQLHLSHPSGEILNALQKIEVDEEAFLAGLDVTEGLRMLKEADADKGEELRLEFTRLFIGPGKIPAPPYESYYTSEKRLLMQEAAVIVRKKYLEAGLVMKNLYSSPEDHIASEFEFMYYLCKKSCELLKESRKEEAAKFLKMQDEFLEEHLARWVPTFCEDIIKSTNHDFFKGLALFTGGFIEEDVKAVKELRNLNI